MEKGTTIRATISLVLLILIISAVFVLVTDYDFGLGATPAEIEPAPIIQDNRVVDSPEIDINPEIQVSNVNLNVATSSEDENEIIFSIGNHEDVVNGASIEVEIENGLFLEFTPDPVWLELENSINENSTQLNVDLGILNDPLDTAFTLDDNNNIVLGTALIVRDSEQEITILLNEDESQSAKDGILASFDSFIANI